MAESATLEERSTQKVPEFVYNYRPLESDKEFDRTEFMDGYTKHQSLKGILKTLTEDSSNFDVRIELGKLLFGNEAYFMNMDPSVIRKFTELALADASEGTPRYVQFNTRSALDDLSDQAYVNLITKRPDFSLTKTGNKDHDDMVALSTEIKKMQGIAEKEDVAGMTKYVQDQVKSWKKAPNWVKKLVKLIAEIPGASPKLFERAYQAKSALLLGSLIDESGKLKRDKARTLIDDSLDQLQDEYVKADDKGKEKIWKKQQRPYYTALADELAASYSN
jgi:hypothetical protein